MQRSVVWQIIIFQTLTFIWSLLSHFIQESRYLGGAIHVSDFHIHNHIIITIISQVSKFNLNFVYKLKHHYLVGMHQYVISVINWYQL